MKYVLLTVILLFNYCIKNIQLSYSEKEQHYRIVATSKFMSRTSTVSIDFDLTTIFWERKSPITGSSQIKKINTNIPSFYKLGSESWVMFTALL